MKFLHWHPIILSVSALSIAIAVLVFHYKNDTSEPNIVGIEEITMAETLKGTWVVDGFDEFVIIISEGQIVVSQGDVPLWIGSFNTNMPMTDEFIVTSNRNPNVELPYINTDTLTLDFLYKDGVLLYVDPVLQVGLDFRKEF